ncbi:MAG: FAD-binding oxidoreductase [Deltaproteobacteria bacterium]|nr:MAG: FAD-binding oxidoreductase [Deltaproteobacteria bacterium]
MHEIASQKSAPANIDDVRQIRGFDRIRSGFPIYLSDESKMTADAFEWLFFPANEAELCAVVRQMAKSNIKMTVCGARTGLAGGCLPSQGALIAMDKFNRITGLHYDSRAEEWRVQSGCAVSLSELDKCLATKSIPDLEHRTDEAGQAALARFREEKARYFYPPDPTETSASLGGTVATNASGSRTYRYGPTRDWVRGIRVVLANGEVLSIPRGKYFASPGGRFVIYDSAGNACEIMVPDCPMPRTKSTAGYFAAPHMDLIDLFIGSEGTLGIVTHVEVGLLPWQPRIAMILFLNDDGQAIELAPRLRRALRLPLNLLEFYSGYALSLLRNLQREDSQAVDMPPIPENAGAALFMELPVDPEDDELNLEILATVLDDCGINMKRSWAAVEPKDMERFRKFRHMLPETVSAIIAERKKTHPQLHRVSADLAVPDAHLAAMWQIYRSTLDSAGFEWLAYGHIGNNHLHVNVLPRDQKELAEAMGFYMDFAHKAVEFGGTVSAEHGIGKIKTKFMGVMFDEAMLAQMRAVKTALDPGGLLGPGNIFGAG